MLLVLTKKSGYLLSSQTCIYNASRITVRCYISIKYKIEFKMGGGRRGMHIGYWWEIQKERDHWEDEDVGEWTILK
jgi:hypothetical protein